MRLFKARRFFAIGVVCLVFGCFILPKLGGGEFELKPHQKCSKNEIDVVYTWVNGSDPKFQSSLIYEIALLGEKKLSGEAAIAARFYDWNTMKYSIRSVEKFAPFTRHLYIVTNGQVPHWLNTTNPKVHLVTHEEIFPNKTHLPTFNSNAIEHHLHRIKGLCDKFLYFNDDVFLSSNISKDDFLYGVDGQWIYTDFKVQDCCPGCPIDKTGNGMCNLACNNTFCNFDGNDCNYTKRNMSFEISKSNNGAWMSSLASANGILSEKFGVAKRYYISHTPHFLDKHILTNYTKFFAKYIGETSASKFREGSNVPLAFGYFNFIMSKHSQGQLKGEEKNRYSYKTRSGYDSGFVQWVGINSNPTNVKKNLEGWSNRRPKFAFLQDGTSGKSPNNAASQKVLDDHLQMMFPTPSQFERSSSTSR